MSKRRKAAHHRGTFQQDSAKIRAAANADPHTQCWRCARTLAEIQQTNPQAKWTAGHIQDGQVGGPLAAECSRCNYSAGARLRNGQNTGTRNTRHWG